MRRFRVKEAVCCRALFAVMASAFSGHAASVGAVNELWVVDTAAPETLQTHVIETSSGFSSLGRLTYEIGFSTKEQIDLGFLFDSITLSVARITGEDSANVVTGDVFGMTIAPLSPNGLLANGGVTVQQVAPRMTLLPDATTAFAYTVEVSLPPSLTGVELRNSFSFFNNGDAVESRAYAVVVPEPSAAALVGITGTGFLMWRWRRRAGA